LSRTAAADIVIDQFKLGYGVYALESWALGLPVVANAEDWIEDLILQEIGYLPYVATKPDELEAAVRALMTDASFITEAEDRGQKYLRDHHAFDVVGNKLAALYNDACRS
jgi:glycosyltransferase involved in cell wall biosynthesis